MSEYLPTLADFESVTTTVHAEQISRPSLSYWQDAWIRLKKNTRAIISLYIVILLALFTLLGPVIWDVDPALQDLGQISQAPSLPKRAVLLNAPGIWDGIILDDFPSEPEEFLDVIPAPRGLRTFETATTHGVRLVWDPVVGAGGYNRVPH